MAEIKTLTPSELVGALIEWKQQNPEAFQLDGAKQPHLSGGTFCYVVHGNKEYRVAMDTNIHGINYFLKMSKKLGSATRALKAHSDNGRSCLRIRGPSLQANGWLCYENIRARNRPVKYAA